MTRGRAGAVSTLALCGLMLAVHPVAAVTTAGSDGAAPYRTAPDAEPVRGSATSADGPSLKPGTYTDTISAGEKKFYQVMLDDTSNAFVSTVLAPPPGTEAGVLSGIRVSLASPQGERCSNSSDVTFKGTTARPIAGYATRRIEANRACQDAGSYLYTVEWIGSDAGPGSAGWPIELKFMAEPGLKADAQAPSAPVTWSSQAPTAQTGVEKSLTGGTGFNDAPAVGEGVWRDELSPGESRFYKVPVDWGQQLFLDAELANSPTGQAPAVVDGLQMALYNTARGLVDGAGTSYLGKQAAVSLGTAPVAFSYRYRPQVDAISAMRFSGWYYVRVTLDQRIGSTLPLILRVGVEGDPQPGPAYDGDATAAGFGITDEGREAAQVGRVEDGSTQSAAMKAVGIAGISLGTVLLLGLAVWTAIGRGGGTGRRGNVAEKTHLPREP
jgi:hypothetical protein